MTATHRRALVLDANILIRAVLGTQVRNLILEHDGNVLFFTPQVCVDDARRYLPDLLASRGVDPASAMALLDGLLTYIKPLEAEWLEEYGAVAKARLASRDLDDWPVLAAALALSCPIWTQDADFFGVGVATWTSEHVIGYLKNPH